jgi:hypothetical protein
MKLKKLIYYTQGCYGTFVDWTCRKFDPDYQSEVVDRPFGRNGNSHSHYSTGIDTHLMTTTQCDDYLASETNNELSRWHWSIQRYAKTEYPHYTISFLRKELSYLARYSQVLVLHPTETSKVWWLHNELEKIYVSPELYTKKYEPMGISRERLRDAMFEDINDKIFSRIEGAKGKNFISMYGKTSFKDLEPWELRESMVYTEWFECNGSTTCWDILKKEFPEVKFVAIDQLRDNFRETVIDYMNFFNINADDLDLLDQVGKEWLELQVHHSKDKLLGNIINSLISNTECDWSTEDITLLDEVYIQSELLRQGVEIKCFGLNKFPTNTKDFNPYLIF